MRKIFIYSFLLLVSCNYSRNYSINDIEDKNLTLLEYDFCSEQNQQHESDSIVFVPLETNDQSLISSINKILYRDGVYYIFDKIQAMIFLFNANGSFITKIHNIGNGPGEYADISDFDLDADLNVYVSSILGRKIIKYRHPDYKSFTEYETNATVMEIAVDNKSGRIWATNVFKTEDGFCLGFYSDGNFVPVISSRGIEDNANTSFKAQSFYKSENCLFFNPRYSPYIYKIENDEVSKYMKIVSNNFIESSDVEKENNFRRLAGVNTKYPIDKCLISGVNSFYKCGDNYLTEIRRNHGAPLLLEYEAKHKKGSLFCPLLDRKIKVYTQIAAVSSDFYISYISAQSFLNNYEEDVVGKYKLSFDSNPVLLNIYMKM